MSHKENEKQIDKLTEQINELENKYKRSLADYQNLEKRTEEDRRRFIEYANEELIKKLLSVLQDLEKAAEHLNDNGLNKVKDNFIKTLESYGLAEIMIELGKTQFDPNLHEAIESVEGEEGKIMKIYRKGYILNSKVIQIAIVAVGNKSK